MTLTKRLKKLKEKLLANRNVAKSRVTDLQHILVSGNSIFIGNDYSMSEWPEELTKLYYEVLDQFSQFKRQGALIERLRKKSVEVEARDPQKFVGTCDDPLLKSIWNKEVKIVPEELSNGYLNRMIKCVGTISKQCQNVSKENVDVYDSFFKYALELITIPHEKLAQVRAEVSRRNNECLQELDELEKRIQAFRAEPRHSNLLQRLRSIEIRINRIEQEVKDERRLDELEKNIRKLQTKMRDPGFLQSMRSDEIRFNLEPMDELSPEETYTADYDEYPKKPNSEYQHTEKKRRVMETGVIEPIVVNLMPMDECLPEAKLPAYCDESHKKLAYEYQHMEKKRRVMETEAGEPIMMNQEPV